jgi:hypothetical protein
VLPQVLGPWLVQRAVDAQPDQLGDAADALEEVTEGERLALIQSGRVAFLHLVDRDHLGEQEAAAGRALGEVAVDQLLVG